MFELEQQMDDGMHAAIDFLNADTNVRNALINNIMQSGISSLEDIGNEVSRLMRRKDIFVKPEDIKDALTQTYQYGLERFIGEYDNSSLSERDIFNENVLVDENGLDNVKHRKRTIGLMVDDLDCRDHHVPNCWADFVKRGYSQIENMLYKKYGDNAVETFGYYFNYDTMDILKVGLTSGLTNAYNKTIEEVTYLDVASKKLEDNVVSSLKESKVDYASMFK